MAHKRERPAAGDTARGASVQQGSGNDPEYNPAAAPEQPRRRSAELAAHDVYDGRQRLGAVVERQSGQWEAAPASGPSLGLLTSAEAATRAVLAHARGGRP